MDTEALNSEFGGDGQVRVFTGKGGLPMISVENTQAQALISLHAGQVLSYRPNGCDDDLLFVSKKAYYAPGKAIKGGVPICWPWFGADPEGRGRPAHGFVRSMPWTLLGTATLASGATRISLGFPDEEATRDQWPHPVRLTLDITVGATLVLELITQNPSDAPLKITQAFHTYFRVGDATQSLVTGLEGCQYVDKAANGNDAVITQEGPIRVAGEVNRIYQQVPPVQWIEDPVLARRIRISAHNSATCIVWNPWVETARAMADLDDEDYRVMLCVETANAADEVIEIAPGAEARLGAEYAIEPL